MNGTWLRRVLVLLVPVTLTWAGDSDLKLELESNVRTLRLGQESTLKLRIAGPGIGRLTEPSEDLGPKDPAAGAFVYELKFKPQREGDFTFGPYQLSFNGRLLTLNLVSIFVLPAWDGTYGTFFRVDRDSITLGESIELVIEKWSTAYEPKRYLFTRDETFTFTTGEFLSHRTSSDKGTLVHMRSSWLITPKQAGVFRITRDLFQSFPEGVVPPDITVTVREKDPPPEPDHKTP
ncbi:MAG: hypothetical protein FJ280_27045 [Planctomycetes bacterium]|nr:hypothetical protein [Planctomycetota bacterium]